MNWTLWLKRRFIRASNLSNLKLAEVIVVCTITNSCVLYDVQISGVHFQSEYTKEPYISPVLMLQLLFVYLIEAFMELDFLFESA